MSDPLKKSSNHEANLPNSTSKNSAIEEIYHNCKHTVKWLSSSQTHGQSSKVPDLGTGVQLPSICSKYGSWGWKERKIFSAWSLWVESTLQYSIGISWDSKKKKEKRWGREEKSDMKDTTRWKQTSMKVITCCYNPMLMLPAIEVNLFLLKRTADAGWCLAGKSRKYLIRSYLILVAIQKTLDLTRYLLSLPCLSLHLSCTQLMVSLEHRLRGISQGLPSLVTCMQNVWLVFLQWSWKPLLKQHCPEQCQSPFKLSL